MYKYQIHKLTKGEKEANAIYLEDILTSDVFGTLFYFPYSALLYPFLDQVRQKNPRSNFKIPEDTPSRFDFWRSISWKEHLPKLKRFSIEPDVIIEWQNLFLMVEAKYGSLTDPEELLREYLAGSYEIEQEQKFYLLLIDKNLSRPKVSYPGSPEKITLQEYFNKKISDLNLSDKFPPHLINSTLLWINWQSTYKVIDSLLNKIDPVRDTEKKILKDLLTILDRKGLILFEPLLLHDFDKYSLDLNLLFNLIKTISFSPFDVSNLYLDRDAVISYLKQKDFISVSDISKISIDKDVIFRLLTDK